MIPLFPKFKSLELEDRKEIEEITKQYPPYSDYNFVSLWSYDVEKSTRISLLHGNLVVKFFDYFGIESFYSFIGTTKVKETITALLSHAQTSETAKKLVLIPEITITSNLKIFDNFRIEEDKDNFDYILSINDISKLIGNKYGAKRNFVNRFTKKYTRINTAIFDLKKPELQKQIIKLFLIWEKQSQKTRSETQRELIAIQRLLVSADFFNLISLGIFIDGRLVAFSINEIVHDNYGLIHFEKANASYIGVFQYLKKITALNLQKLDCVFINYEQDLGIPGLRKAKESWHPINFLKKYIISLKEK